jgi:hypothetical protein
MVQQPRWVRLPAQAIKRDCIKPVSRFSGPMSKYMHLAPIWRLGWSRTSLTIAKLPLAKDIDDFTYKGTPFLARLQNALADEVILIEKRKEGFEVGVPNDGPHVDR